MSTDPSQQPPSPADVTRLLKAWRAGDESALARLTPLVYAELRRLAHHHMTRERRDHVLQSSALVNEAYVRLIGQPAVVEWRDRNHFFAVSARLMRQILIDFARAQQTGKRGNRVTHVDVSSIWASSPPDRAADFLDVDRAVTQLAEIQPRLAQIVELRFFGGLSNQEIAAVLEISEATVMRGWRTAKAWLYNALTPAVGV